MPDNITRSSAFDSKQPATTRQTLKDVSNKYEYDYMFFIPRPPVNFPINRRVPNRFFGIRDLAYFKAEIRDFEEKGEQDSGL